MLDARLVKPDLRGQFFKNLEIIKESFCWILIGHSLFKHNRFSYVFSNSWNNTPHIPERAPFLEVQGGNRAYGVERFLSAAPIPNLGILRFVSHAWN
jgi:hypothetical protein